MRIYRPSKWPYGKCRSMETPSFLCPRHLPARSWDRCPNAEGPGPDSAAPGRTPSPSAAGTGCPTCNPPPGRTHGDPVRSAILCTGHTVRKTHLGLSVVVPKCDEFLSGCTPQRCWLFFLEAASRMQLPARTLPNHLACIYPASTAGEELILSPTVPLSGLTGPQPRCTDTHPPPPPPRPCLRTSLRPSPTSKHPQAQPSPAAQPPVRRAETSLRTSQQPTHAPTDPRLKKKTRQHSRSRLPCGTSTAPARSAIDSWLHDSLLVLYIALPLPPGIPGQLRPMTSSGPSIPLAVEPQTLRARLGRGGQRAAFTIMHFDNWAINTLPMLDMHTSKQAKRLAST